MAWVMFVNSTNMGWRLYFSRPNLILYHHLVWFPTQEPPTSVVIQDATNILDLKIGENKYVDSIEDDCNPDPNYDQMGNDANQFEAHFHSDIHSNNYFSMH